MSTEGIRHAAKQCYWSMNDALGQLKSARQLASTYFIESKDIALFITFISKEEAKLEIAKQFCRSMSEESSDLNAWRDRMYTGV